MAAEIRVPALGESIVEATVSKWRKKVGEPVKAGETLVELETDKINVEVAAEQDGVLEQIAQPEGANVNVGDVLGIIGTGAGASGEGSNGAQTAAPAPPAAQPAPVAAGDTGEAQPAGAVSAPVGRRADVVATPVARNVAAAEGVDLSGVSGSGPGGRVTKGDVTAQVTGRPAGTPASPPPQTAPQTPDRPQGGGPAADDGGRRAEAQPPQLPNLAPRAATDGREERMKLSRRRQTIARRLVEAQHTAAMLTTFNEIDMSAVVELRKRRNPEFEKRYGVKLGFMSFFVKAVIGALKFQPRLNAEIQGDELVLKKYYDIGIAVAAEEGLVVPVLRDADRLSFAEIEKGIADLAAKARANQLSLADLQGGTFTITNGGIFGSLMSTPILNAPQVGILGMHAIKERPVALDGQVVVRPMMYVALSYDHRIVDGSEAVRFLVRVKELVEDPESLLLEG
jgi:2-oxoglutarate dehydrogenase E2 component (dihydrolipoamide succinyltransferase)